MTREDEEDANLRLRGEKNIQFARASDVDVASLDRIYRKNHKLLRFSSLHDCWMDIV